jgi:hypothetical protein
MTIWTCGVCSENFERPGQRVYRFCSPACRGAARRKPDHQRLIHTCEVCQRTFTKRGTRTYRFCSVVCRSAGQRPERPSDAELREMYVDQGMTANDIARLCDRDPKTTWAWLRAAEIATRARGSYVDQQFKPGQPSHMKGKKHTAEAIARMTEARRCVPRERFANNGAYLKARSGASHPNWKGGITSERQSFNSSPEWKEAARAVWIRDKATCQRCGCRPPRKGPKHNRGHVHHIVSFKVKELRLTLANLVLLCADCHRWAHSNANATKEFIG